MEKLSNLSIPLLIFLYFVQWGSIFLLFWAKPLVSVTVVPLLIAIMLYLSRKKGLLLGLSLISLYLAHEALFIELPQTISFEKCFIFNESYPGTDRYDQCVLSLKRDDYIKAIFDL